MRIFYAIWIQNSNNESDSLILSYVIQIFLLSHKIFETEQQLQLAPVSAIGKESGSLRIYENHQMAETKGRDLKSKATIQVPENISFQCKIQISLKKQVTFNAENIHSNSDPQMFKTALET